VTPPCEPFSGGTLSHIVTYWRGVAGITLRTPHKPGLHALRHSLATRLLEQGTPVHTIADILGHTSVASTRLYAKADVEALRSVALDPEEVTHGACATQRSVPSPSGGMPGAMSSRKARLWLAVS
jgi:integrase